MDFSCVLKLQGGQVRQNGQGKKWKMELHKKLPRWPLTPSLQVQGGLVSLLPVVMSAPPVTILGLAPITALLSSLAVLPGVISAYTR